MVNYNAVGLDLGGLLDPIIAGFKERQATRLLQDYAASALGGEPSRAQQLLSIGAPATAAPTLPAPSAPRMTMPTGTRGGQFDAMAPRIISDLQRDFGLTRDQAAGFVGNLGHESGGFSQLQEISPLVKGSRGGFGWAQWTGPRRVAFERFAASNGLDPASYEANYGFLKHELANTPEGNVIASLRQAPDARTAARVVQDEFLRPGIPHTGSRMAWTDRALRAGGTASDADMPAAGAATVGRDTFVMPGGAGTAAERPTIPPERQAILRQMIASGNPTLQKLALSEIQSLSAAPKYDFLKGEDGRIYRTDSRGGIVDVGVGGGRQRRTATVGNSLVDQDTGEVVYRGEREQVRTLISPEERAAAGVPREYTGPVQVKPDGTLHMPGSAAPPKPESTYDVERSKAFAKRREAIEEDEASATKGRNAIKVMQRLTDDPNFYSGFGGKFAQSAKSAMTALGVKDRDYSAPGEVFQSFAREVTMGKLGGKLGTGVSNTDLTFIEGMGPQLTNSIAGNKLLLKYTDKLLERQQQVGRMARDYERRNGGRIDSGFDVMMAEWSEKNPLFTHEDMAQAERAAAEISPASQGLFENLFGKRGQPKVIQKPKGTVTIEPWTD